MLQTTEGIIQDNEQASVPVSSESQVKIEGIAVLGSNPATVEMAPFEMEDWLIYACSPHNVEHRTLPRVTEWFECHMPIQDATRSYRYLRALEDMDCPVWMRDQENMGCFKNAVAYPEGQLKKIFCDYMFTSSIAYIMAKAIIDCQMNNIPNLGLFGIMQASPNEYTYQRPGIQYFIWEANQRGINVIAPDVSRLFEQPKEQW